MKIRFFHGKILTMEENRPAFDGELHVEDDRITYVGPGLSAEEISRREPFDREIDAGGNLLMPGFKNAHTHSGMTFLRSFADDMPLDEWLNRQVFPMEAKLDEEKIYWLSMLAFLEYLTSGITAAFDMYLIPDAVGKAARDFGFRTVLVGAKSGVITNGTARGILSVTVWVFTRNTPPPGSGWKPWQSLPISFRRRCSPTILRRRRKSGSASDATGKRRHR